MKTITTVEFYREENSFKKSNKLITVVQFSFPTEAIRNNRNECLTDFTFYTFCKLKIICYE